MNSDEKRQDTSEPRAIQLRLDLAGGHTHTLTLSEDAPELVDIFRFLASPEAADGLVQLPLNEGRAACSFRLSQLVSVLSEPPVVVSLEAPAEPPPATSVARRVAPRCVVIDDFLSPDEHRDMLYFTLGCEGDFSPGTVTSDTPYHRQNLVILDFGATERAKLIQNRLLVWFPLLARAFGEPIFPLESIESQLTAANHGHYFKTHHDAGELTDTRLRTLSCIYFFHREPKGFAGGELRLYDVLHEGERRIPTESFQLIEPATNRLAVFPSDQLHEVLPVRCPSREFADSRFSVTSWIRRAEAPNPETLFGWGTFRCGVVAPHFSGRIVS